jgi:hypothetical protein
MTPLTILWVIDWLVAPMRAPIAADTAPVMRNHLRPAISLRRDPMVTMIEAPRFQAMAIQGYRVSGPKSALMYARRAAGISWVNRYDSYMIMSVCVLSVSLGHE